VPSTETLDTTLFTVGLNAVFRLPLRFSLASRRCVVPLTVAKFPPTNTAVPSEEGASVLTVPPAITGRNEVSKAPVVRL